MKKMFFFALAAAGMLTACSNDDTLGGNGEQNVSEQQIRLGVASSKVQTRGTGTVGGMTDDDNKWAGQTLWVYMLQKGSMDLALYKAPAAGGVATPDVEVFNNKEFKAPTTADNTKSGLATTADGTIAYYPVSGNYDFWGYRVDDAAVGGTPTVKIVDDNGDEVTADHMDQATKRVVDIKIDGSQDIMAGKAAPSADEVTKLGGYADNFYSAYAARKGVQPNITFEHLLTRFTFEVRAGSKATAGLPAGGNTDAVKVTGVSVGSKTTGTLTVAYTGATKAAADLLTFTGDASPLILKQRDEAVADNNAPLVALKPVTLTWTDDAATIGDVLKVGEALLVAPGEKEYPLTIALSQDVLQKVGEAKVTMPLEQKATIKMDGTKTFEPGKSYKVTITVYGLEDIRVTATLVPWADGGSIDIDDDRDPNNGKYTEPAVTPEPIEP
ncbi:fimbrillin family protein [Leyella stercorea]|uniref:fimbrillin family protein n=1 Tax=Leyella stercorea TaxID=363265 RepID=UPI002430896A|nr:fimbrillin family protein [Leyella stercorea]